MLIASLFVSLIAVQAEAPVALEANPPAKPQKICKSIKTTGSRLNVRRLCATKAEWERVERETQEDVRNAQNQSKQGDNR